MVTKRYGLVFGLLVLIVLALVAPAGAADVTIDASGSSALDISNISAAISAAGSSGTVILNPGTYYADGISLSSGYGITIRANTSNSGTAVNTIIDGMNTGSSIFVMPGGNVVRLDNLTLQKGKAENGGAIHQTGSMLSVTSVNFIDCTAANSGSGNGGAIYNDQGLLSIAASTFADCAADNSGGAVYNTGVATITAINSSIFAGCTAGYGSGGAIFNDNSAINAIDSSTFSDCTAGNYGGAIQNNGGTMDSITSSTFSDCEAESLDGGAISVYGSTGTIASVASSTFTGCTAGNNGGAIENYGGMISSIASSTFSDCNAGNFGGAMHYEQGPIPAIDSSTFSGCTAGNYGGAIFDAAGGSTVRFSRFYGNSAPALVCDPMLCSSNTAADNWWGTNDDPSSQVYGTVTTSPWLVLNASAVPSSITIPATSTIRMNLTNASDGTTIADTTSGGIFVPDMIPVAYSLSGVSGSLAPEQGNVTTGANSTVFAPSSAGTALITITVDGQPVIVQVTVLNLLPVAGFTGTPTTGTAPLAVQFNDTSTGSPTMWNWSFGDGTWFNTTDSLLRNRTHQYAAGTWTVNLTVSNAGGTDTLSENDYISVAAAPELSVSEGYSGTFTQGVTGGTFTVTVSNTAASSTVTSGTTTLTETLPTGFSAASSGGTGWTCSGTGTVTCTSTQAVTGGASFNVISIVVAVPATALNPTTTNAATASGGGAADSATSGTVSIPVVQVPASIIAGPGTTPQSALIHTAFANALYVTVLDAANNPVQGVSVDFSAPGSGVSGVFSNNANIITVPTNSAGIASAGYFTANGLPGGPYSVTATTGLISANLLLTNTASPAPAVSSISPASGPASGGTSVTITGTDFTGATSVKFGATGATSFTEDSATQITATSPAGSGTADITVTTAGGTSATSSADQFTYIAAPAISGISPSAGPVAGGTSVIITGTGFSGATQVRFGGTAASSYTVNSPTQITAASPAGSGTVDVTVTTVAGTSTTSSADQFTYTPVTTAPTTAPTTVPTTSPTTAAAVPVATLDTSGNDDGFPSATAAPMETGEGALPLMTVTVNIGGDSKAWQAIVTGTGLRDLIVTGTEQHGPSGSCNPPAGSVFQYLSLEPARYGTIRNAVINFTVPQSWLNANRIDPKSIVLYHMTPDCWQPLPTTFLSQKDSIVYYSTVSPGFSQFAIAGTPATAAQVVSGTPPLFTKEAVQTPAATAVVKAPVTTQTTAPPAASPQPAAPSPLLNIVLVIAAIGILAGGGFMVRRWWIHRQNPALFRGYD